MLLKYYNIYTYKINTVFEFRCKTAITSTEPTVIRAGKPSPGIVLSLRIAQCGGVV